MEERNEATGQFEPSTDGLFGREAEQAAAGFKPMPERLTPEPEAADPASPREAADDLSASRAGTEPDDVVVYFKADTGDQVDPNETVTLERAAADLTTYRNSKVDSAANSISKDFAAEIDALRTAAVKDGLDPKLTGIEDKVSQTADAPAGDVEENKSGAEPAEPGTEHLDPEVQRALKIPAVKEALEREFAQADQARQQYTGSLQAGQQMMQATVAALAPQLQGMPLEHWPQAIQALSQVDPVRGQLVADTLNNWNALQQAQQQNEQQRAHVEHAQREAVRQQYSKQSDEALGPMTFAEKAEMAEELVNYVGEFGISREALMHEAQTNLAIHHPAFQKMAADAINYRRMQNASKAVATRGLPPVQRPGASSRVSQSDTSDLAKRFASSSGNNQLKAAADLIVARRNARRG